MNTKSDTKNQYSEACKREPYSCSNHKKSSEQNEHSFESHLRKRSEKSGENWKKAR